MLSRQPFLKIFFVQDPDCCRKYPATGTTRYTSSETEGLKNEMIAAMNAIPVIRTD
jgi:hypothetical protein